MIRLEIHLSTQSLVIMCSFKFEFGISLRLGSVAVLVLDDFPGAVVFLSLCSWGYWFCVFARIFFVQLVVKLCIITYNTVVNV